MQALKYEAVVGNTFGRFVVEEGFCASLVGHRMNFVRNVLKLSKERDVRMKSGLKTKEMSRQKVSKEILK